MLFNFKKFLLPAVIFSILCSSYRDLSLTDFFSYPSATENLSLDPKDQGIFVSAKVYTLEKSCLNLSRDLLREGYIPIELAFYNQSAHTYLLSAESVDLKLTSSQTIFKQAVKGSIARKVGFSVAGLFFWPMIIPSTIDSIHSHRVHKKLKKELEAKTLKGEEEKLPPYSSMRRILYVQEEEFKREFAVSLRDADSGKQVQVPVDLKNF